MGEPTNLNPIQPTHNINTSIPLEKPKQNAFIRLISNIFSMIASAFQRNEQGDVKEITRASKDLPDSKKLISKTRSSFNEKINAESLGKSAMDDTEKNAEEFSRVKLTDDNPLMKKFSTYKNPQEAMKEFYKFTAKEFSNENLDFLIAMHNPTIPLHQKYESYIGNNTINISSPTKTGLEKIMSNKDQTNLEDLNTLMKAAEKEVSHMLEHDTFGRFKKLYKEGGS